jgi:putative alpha-1,2-mannosidase
VETACVYAQFDQPLKAESTVKDGAIANLVFDLTATNRVVQLKVGISSVSIDNAKLNLEAENPGWAFDGPDGVKTKADKDWNERLNTIQLDIAKPGIIDTIKESDKKAKAQRYVPQFYSALYRTMGGPTVYSDVNGDYRSMDQRANLNLPAGEVPERKKENVANYNFKLDGKDAGYKTHYSGFSMWDTYRSLAQFQALMFPEETSEMMQSLVAMPSNAVLFPIG